MLLHSSEAGVQGPADWLTGGTQGLRIASYYWPALAGPDASGVFQPASQPRGTVLLLHGHGAYLLELLKAQVRLALPG